MMQWRIESKRIKGPTTACRWTRSTTLLFQFRITESVINPFRHWIFYIYIYFLLQTSTRNPPGDDVYRHLWTSAMPGVELSRCLKTSFLCDDIIIISVQVHIFTFMLRSNRWTSLCAKYYKINTSLLILWT